MNLNEKLFKILETLPKNDIIGVNYIRAFWKINDEKYKKVVCSISGGSDSDIVLDICHKVDLSNKVDYVWFDTGLEYEATKKHLTYLEKKYNIKIKTEKAIKPVALSCHLYGQPFLSKNVSEMISRLQKHHFQWEDESFEILFLKYPNCKSALEWWCNTKKSKRMGICHNQYLKEFIIQNPPEFLVSNKCCQYAKKDVAHKIIKSGNYDLEITGIRKAEGGSRSTSYKSCFDESYENCDRYRPIFWYKNDTKSLYQNDMKIEHSACYQTYGLKRTGCAGCPFGRNFEFELSVIQKYEPKLYKAIHVIFKDSYQYTRKYLDFCNNAKTIKKETN